MGQASPMPCKHSACPALVYDGSGYCSRHSHEAPKAWEKKTPQSGRGGRPWRSLRLRILERDGWLCQCEDCRQRAMPLLADEVDHIDNTRDEQGRLNDDPDNLRAVNHDCHKRITQAQALQGRTQS